jgi:membrane protease YdiL (CAAX protease family)
MDGPSEPDDVCQSCGARLEPSDNFCPSCGAEVGAPTSATSRTPDEQRTRRSGRSTPGTPGPGPAAAGSAAAGQPSGGNSPGAPGILRGKESRFRTLGVALLLVATAMFVPLIGLAVLGAVLFAIGLPDTLVLLGLTIMQFAWFVAFGLWYLRYRGYDRDSVTSYFGVEMPSLKDIGLILLTWFVMLVTAAIVGTLLVEVVPELLGVEQTEPAENSVNQIIEQNPEIVLGAIAFMFLVVGPAEEIMFRGVVQNRIRERFSKVPGVVIASLLFASVHVVALASTDPVAISMTIAVLFVTSLGLGWIYEYTGNLVVPILLHGFHNSVIVAITALSAMSNTEPQQAVLLVPELLTALVP